MTNSLSLLTPYYLYVLNGCICSSLQQCANALKKYAKRFQTRLDQEDVTFESYIHPCSANINLGRRRREVHHRNKRGTWGQNALKGSTKSLTNIGGGIISIVDGAVTGVAGLSGIETVSSPLHCFIEKQVLHGSLTENKNIGARMKNRFPDFLLNENNELDLSKLAESLEFNSLKSIREKLINVLGNVFAFLKELFRHTKKVFYVVTICLMITDGYK